MAGRSKLSLCVEGIRALDISLDDLTTEFKAVRGWWSGVCVCVCVCARVLVGTCQTSLTAVYVTASAYKTVRDIVWANRGKSYLVLALLLQPLVKALWNHVLIF